MCPSPIGIESDRACCGGAGTWCCACLPGERGMDFGSQCPNLLRLCEAKKERGESNSRIHDACWSQTATEYFAALVKSLQTDPRPLYTARGIIQTQPVVPRSLQIFAELWKWIIKGRQDRRLDGTNYLETSHNAAAETWDRTFVCKTATLEQ